MAELKETPVQNPKALALARALRAVRDFSNKAQIPDSVPLVGGQGLGDMFLGKSPEEVENWGYGNYPYRMPEMSNIPVMKTGRAEGVFDAASMAPIGAGGVGDAGTLPFKLRHKNKKLVDDWVENGVMNKGGVPYPDAQKHTPTVITNLVNKADKLVEPEELYRLAHDQDEVKALKNLQPGEVFTPGRLMSTSRDPDTLGEVADIFPDQDTLAIAIEAPKGVRIGGDLGPGNANYYNEFLVRPDAMFERVDTGPAGEYRLRALTDSEANLRRRIEKLRKNPPQYHASPNDFDEFDPNKFGSFSGHASYGKGVYSTRSQAAARNHLFSGNNSPESGFLYRIETDPDSLRQYPMLEGLASDMEKINDPKIPGVRFENDPFEIGEPVENFVARDPRTVKIVNKLRITKK